MADCREHAKFVLCGTFVHSTDDDPMVVLENQCLGVVDGKVCYALLYKMMMHDFMKSASSLLHLELNH